MKWQIQIHRQKEKNTEREAMKEEKREIRKSRMFF